MRNNKVKKKVKSEVNKPKFKYKIKYYYDTGDSFHTEENVEGTLDGEWENCDIACENLQRIKEHYEYYKQEDNSCRFGASNKKIDYSDRAWFVDGHGSSLKLLTDEGVEYQIYAPWCGYFETLNEAFIESQLPRISFC